LFACTYILVAILGTTPDSQSSKGAPLFVLKTVEEDHPIPADVDEAYKNKVAEFATRGFRSLGVARKRGDASWEILG
jgi:H+-transporting ATPase